MRVTICKLIYKKVIANQHGRHHAARRNKKRLEQEGMNPHRNQPRIDDRLDEFEGGCGFPLSRLGRFTARGRRFLMEECHNNSLSEWAPASSAVLAAFLKKGGREGDFA